MSFMQHFFFKSIFMARGNELMRQGITFLFFYFQILDSGLGPLPAHDSGTHSTSEDPRSIHIFFISFSFCILKEHGKT